MTFVLPIALLLAGGSPALAGRTGSASRPSCVDTDRIVTRHAIAPDTLGLELAGGRRVAMRLTAACPHLADLDRNYTLVFDQRDGTRLCRGARFRVVDPLVVRSGGTAGYPYCQVSGFDDLPPGR